jgi:hypothetical protein
MVDRAQVLEEAARYRAGCEAPALLSRLSFQSGDLFQAVPEAKSDKGIYLLSAVLHGFEDDVHLVLVYQAVRKRPVGIGYAVNRLSVMKFSIDVSPPECMVNIFQPDSIEAGHSFSPRVMRFQGSMKLFFGQAARIYYSKRLATNSILSEMFSRATVSVSKLSPSLANAGTVEQSIRQAGWSVPAMLCKKATCTTST